MPLLSFCFWQTQPWPQPHLGCANIMIKISKHRRPATLPTGWPSKKGQKIHRLEPRLSTSPKNLDLNKNLNLTKIENQILNLKLKFENWKLKIWNSIIWNLRIRNFNIHNFRIRNLIIRSLKLGNLKIRNLKNLESEKCGIQNFGI